MNTFVPANLPIVGLDMCRKSYVVLLGISFQPTAEGVLFQFRQKIFVTPINISRIEIGGTFLKIRTEFYVAFIGKKFDNITIIRHSFGNIPTRLFGNRKPKIIIYQPLQSVEYSAEYFFFFQNKLLRKVRIVNSI